MALSPIEGHDGLYVGGLWALRRSDSLDDLGITHILSLVDFDQSKFRDFKDRPWAEYGQIYRHLVIDIDDVEDADLLVELPRAVRFIDEALRSREVSEPDSSPEGGAPLHDDTDAPQPERTSNGAERMAKKRGAVFVHCAAGKSRSVAVTIAYLLWKYPHRFDPNMASSIPSVFTARGDAAWRRRRTESAPAAVQAALDLIRQTRPMADPNTGFTEQLALWWEMECPDDVETHPVYQRWAYRREVEEHVAVGQAPSRLRFEDEQPQNPSTSHRDPLSTADPSTAQGCNLRCKKCRRTLATAPFIQPHSPVKTAAGQPCPHHFVEPLGWMRSELERGELSGRLACPNDRCGAAVGRYDWKGLRCACGGWVTPGLSLQRARVDVEVPPPVSGVGAGRLAMGIRLPPGRGGNL